MFVHINDKLINPETIDHVDCNDFMKHGHIRVHYTNEDTECVYGVEATDLIMRLCPSYLEGKRLKYVKHMWAIHNLIGHPLMQFLAWVKLTSWAMKVHDATIPFPKEMSL